MTRCGGRGCRHYRNQGKADRRKLFPLLIFIGHKDPTEARLKRAILLKLKISIFKK
jgi:hypothetical protein